jgi:hypothetical protein
MAMAQAEAVRIVEQSHGIHHRSVVMEWFAHTHEDDVGNFPVPWPWSSRAKYRA